MREAFVHAGLAEVPAILDRQRPYGVDDDGDCFFTQTCSYTLFAGARGAFHVLGAPGFDVPGASGPYHRSWIVVRDVSRVRTLEDLRGKRFAVNELDSNSGMNLPRALFAPLARNSHFFEETIVSGSHAQSADLVTRDAVEAAAIDCVTFALLERYRPMAIKRLRILAETVATPTPPYVTSRSTKHAEVATMKSALERYFADPAHARTRAALFLGGVALCDESVYKVVMDLEDAARRAGYPVLR